MNYPNLNHDVLGRKITLLVMVLLSLTLSACASKPAVIETKAVPPEQTIDELDLPNAYGTGYTRRQLRALGIDGNPLDYDTVYFEYDSSVIDERSNVIASAHARELQTRNSARVTLEGHADERGTRDYNLALGERRAIAVGDLMRAVGASNNMQNVSYGEERPVAPGHNEAAWSKNRRVKISY